MLEVNSNQSFVTVCPYCNHEAEFEFGSEGGTICDNCGEAFWSYTYIEHSCAYAEVQNSMFKKSQFDPDPDVW